MMKSNLNIKDVEMYYEKWTDEYIDSFGEIFQALTTDSNEELIDYIANLINIKNGMKILDAGCGMCGPSVLIAKRYNVDIEAITISQKQLKYSLDNIEKNNLGNKINVIKGDFHQLKNYYENELFDVAYYLESLCHSPEPSQAIESLNDVIKPGGLLYIKDLFRGPDIPNKLEINDYPINAINENFCLRIQTIGKILDVLGVNGYKIIICQRPKFNEVFDKGNAFTAKHNFKLLKNQEGPWTDSGLVFLNWLEILAVKHYS
tara:strand:+ start:12921 stop:13703 length:783 start_codon:yes stop_codon:yes gene_type:complete